MRKYWFWALLIGTGVAVYFVVKKKAQTDALTGQVMQGEITPNPTVQGMPDASAPLQASEIWPKILPIRNIDGPGGINPALL